MSRPSRRASVPALSHSVLNHPCEKDVTMSAAPAVVSREEWLKARVALLQKEKELTHLKDQVAAQRQQLPRVKVEKTYRFETDRGTQTLADLFDGRSQLIVYHFMYGPEWESPCPSCCFVVDHLDGAM